MRRLGSGSRPLFPEHAGAPGSFRAICMDGDIYQDGAMVGNNPVVHGFQEAVRLLGGT